MEKNLTNVSNIAIETVVRIVLLGLILVWGFEIVKPFITPIVWGVIIAVAVLPIYNVFLKTFNGNRKLASGIFTVTLLAALLTPAIILAGSVTESIAEITEKWQSGQISVPPPNESVQEWPVIGEKTYNLWLSASENLEKTLEVHNDTVKKVGQFFVSSLAGISFTVLQFAFSIIVAGIFLASGPVCAKFFNDLSIKLAGNIGAKFTRLAGDVIASVTKGVLGVAVIQSLMAGVGLMALGVPGAGIWAIVVLVLAIVQLPPIIILGPIIVYAYSEFSSTAATLFAVWSVIVSVSDSFLKPLFLGRGLNTPMLVILIGAIGGMMMSSIVGLFIGPVILALIYELFIVWLYGEKILDEQLEASQSDPSLSALTATEASLTKDEQ